MAALVGSWPSVTSATGSWVTMATPWGHQLEVISMPSGKTMVRLGQALWAEPPKTSGCLDASGVGVVIVRGAGCYRKDFNKTNDSANFWHASNLAFQTPHPVAALHVLLPSDSATCVNSRVSAHVAGEQTECSFEVYDG